MFTLLVILAVFLQAAIAGSVYYRRKSGQANTFFMFLVLALAGWSLSNYIAITIPQNAQTIYAIRVVLGFVVIQNTLFYFFTRTFPDTKLRQLPRSNIYLAAYSLLLLAIIQTPLVFKSVIIDHGTANPVVAPGIILFMLHAIFTTARGFLKLFKRYRQTNGQEKTQLLIILFASVIMLLIVPITNFVVSLGLHTTLFVKFSPFYTLAFGALITYAIVAQKLFDIRAAVARSVGYLMVVISMTVVYGIGLFGVIDVVFRGAQHEFLRQILSVILITPLALVFQRTKLFFDKATNKLFYRDAYDIQEVIDKLGHVVVSEIELYRILKDTRVILNDALKASFIEFILIKNNKVYFEARTQKTVDQSMLELGSVIGNQHQEILIADEIRPSQVLKEKLSENKVAVSVRLKTQQQVVGYILFGEKRSGDIYSTQDKRLLELVASQLSISMQNALRFEEIQNFNLTLQAKVEEATRKMRSANEKLKVLDETKDDFISMASHQLRTPLTSIKGYISMVMEGDAGKISKQQEQMLGQAFFSSQRMVYLIADLLNLSRLKTGKFIIETAPVNLAEVVEQEMRQLKESAASRGHTLDYEKPKHFPDLMFDETKIRQVIMNFTDNAIYYTPTGGHIVVKLIDNPLTVELKVVDNGIGVPKTEQPHLFTKFYRAGNARKARPDGTGLGLFMAKKVIVAQGGTLLFESSEGKGSTFGFIFSKSKLAVTDKQPVKS
jgi:signal transduction histidine kinase